LYASHSRNNNYTRNSSKRRVASNSTKTEEKQPTAKTVGLVGLQGRQQQHVLGNNRVDSSTKYQKKRDACNRKPPPTCNSRDVRNSREAGNMTLTTAVTRATMMMLATAVRDSKSRDAMNSIMYASIGNDAGNGDYVSNNSDDKIYKIVKFISLILSINHM
jgi:hypothetical protein